MNFPGNDTYGIKTRTEDGDGGAVAVRRSGALKPFVIAEERAFREPSE